MRIIVDVVGQKLRISHSQKRIVYGSRSFVQLSFSLSSDWDNMNIYARFTQGDNDYSVALDDDNSCYLPSALAVGSCDIMLYGIGGSGGTIIAVTDSNTLTIVEAAYSPIDDEQDDEYSEDYVATTDEVLDYLNIT